MPRYVLHRLPDVPGETTLPEELRQDPRVRLIGELPSTLLIESSAEVAEQWASKIKGWKLSEEQCASIPDPRPKLKTRLR